MITLWENILFFIPVFFAVNLLAAIPGQDDLGLAIRAGVRNFIVGSGFMAGGCALLYFVFEWLLSRPPLW